MYVFVSAKPIVVGGDNWMLWKKLEAMGNDEVAELQQ